MSVLSTRVLKLEGRRASHRERLPHHEVQRILAEIVGTTLAAAVFDQDSGLRERLVTHRTTAEEEIAVRKLAGIGVQPEDFLLKMMR